MVEEVEGEDGDGDEGGDGGGVGEVGLDGVPGGEEGEDGGGSAGISEVRRGNRGRDAVGCEEEEERTARCRGRGVREAHRWRCATAEDSRAAVSQTAAGVDVAR